MIQLIIFDFNRTLYNPDVDRLVPEAKRVLAVLNRRQIPLVLVSRREIGRTDRIANLGLVPYFNQICVVPRKSIFLFKNIQAQAGCKPKEILVIGDRICDEIAIANKLGMRSVRFKQGKFAADLPTTPLEEPSCTISSLREILLLAR